MAKEFAKTFYESRQWKKCRKAYIQQRQAVDGGMCEECGENPGFIVHHKKMLTPENINEPDVSLGFSNLKYVCQECHNKEHSEKKIEGMIKYYFGSDGQPVPYPPCL